MTRIVFFLFFLSLITKSEAQESALIQAKPNIDSLSYSNWPMVSLGSGKISDDGNYMLYVITDLDGKSYTTILKSCKGDWELKFSGLLSVEFTSNSRKALFIKEDTLNIVKLGSKSIERIPNVSTFQLLKIGDWMAYINNSKKEFIFKDLQSGEIRIYKGVNQYVFSDDDKYLALELDDNKSDSTYRLLDIVNVQTGKVISVGKVKSMISMLFNKLGDRLVFMLNEVSDKHKSIWYYKIGTSGPNLIVSNLPSDIDSSYKLGDLRGISEKGKYIFITLNQVNRNIGIKRKNDAVTIWSYLDENLPGSQLYYSRSSLVSYAAVNTLSGRITLVSNADERVVKESNDGLIFLIEQFSGNGSEYEYNWNNTAQKKYYIKCLEKDVKVLLNFKERSLIQLSPCGRFVIYYDKKQAAYCSYEISSGIYRNITSGVNVSWIDYNRDDMIAGPRGICAWLNDDEYVLIYDRFDIWKLDPTGKYPPINLTHGYGLRHNIVFDIGLPLSTLGVISKNDTLLLNAVNLTNKKNGYFRIIVSKADEPEELIMSDAIYHFVNNAYVDTRGSYPVKAKNKFKFIFTMMKSTESPNYFYTENFKSFIPLSKLYPERKYNWYSTELISWERETGKTTQGVLYKPENFDSTKTYPIIFYYYEKKSFSLNEYLFPRFISNECNINIPTFVSNGYLVFTPDIDYVISNPMQGAYDAVISAAEYMSKLPFVNEKKMGIGGCSFGGVETNYLVTHSNLFAAAYSSSSLVDLVSAYGDITRRGVGLHNALEVGQLRMGGTLWENSDLYIKNSAIFNVDKITTPILIMHTTDDAICSFSQALEFFTALRRLGKKAWLLEYPNSNHGITGDFAKDFSIRLNQFFDHYLKGMPPPVWMTNRNPAGMKDGDIEYKLDNEVETPGKGLLMEKGGNE